MLSSKFVKRLCLLLFSFCPFIVGYLFNRAIYTFEWYGSIISLVGLLFCIFWFIVGFISYDFSKSKKESILLGNFFAIISIVLILFQDLIMKRFLPNIFGMLPQMFYQPMIRIAVWVENILLFFTPVRTFWATSLVSFILMLAIYNTGYSMRVKSEQ